MLEWGIKGDFQDFMVYPSQKSFKKSNLRKAKDNGFLGKNGVKVYD